MRNWLANTERDYWRAVLERVAETIRFLSERGLAFRGSDEVIGSSRNGKFSGRFGTVSQIPSNL